jgi:phospholipase A1/A2
VEYYKIILVVVLTFVLNVAAGAKPKPAVPVDDLTTVTQKDSTTAVDPFRTNGRFVSAHKANYFSVDHWPRDVKAQVKFQLSMKFPVLKANLYVFKYDIFPAYVAYSQKSLWNIGQRSMPFEESNYNPEFFLDYRANATIMGRFRLRNIIICPIEHESDGLTGGQSRSWNRQYVLIRIALKSKEELEVTNSFLADKASLYVKLWYATGMSDQDAYLQSLGRKEDFLDYMGRGEVGISFRNFLWGGLLRDYQLDVKTPIFRETNKESYEVEFRQQLPNMNFALYLQYWYGYGETLLRFDKRENRGLVGLSFSY